MAYTRQRKWARLFCRNLCKLQRSTIYFLGNVKTMYEFIAGGEPAGSRGAWYPSPPATQNTMYSRPPTSYTDGTPSEPVGRAYVHKTFPVSWS